MTAPLQSILGHLEQLVAHDTQNPPRNLSPESSLFATLREALPGFETSIDDGGEGCLGFLATRGTTDTLFNVHIDTVPATDAWTKDPFTLERGNDRAIGLGACDIKGAAACLLAAAAETDAPAAFLFTTDEEAGSSVAVRRFLETSPRYERVIVGEPTRSIAVTRHRGIYAGTLTLAGEAGHASQGGLSAVHEAARFITQALTESWAKDDRLNFGRIEGGIKPNMIAPSCEIQFGLRCMPGESPDPRVERLRVLAGAALETDTTRFWGPALPPADPEARFRQVELNEYFYGLDIEVGSPVDFWTEAALFSKAGLPVAVLGPGDIAQAHTADEFVLYDHLTTAYNAYLKILTDG